MGRAAISSGGKGSSLAPSSSNTLGHSGLSDSRTSRKVIPSRTGESLGLRVVGAFDIRSQIAGEFDRFAADLGAEEIARHLKLTRAHATAEQSYTAQPYPGRISLFRAAEQPASRAQDRTLGWDALAFIPATA